MTLKKMCLLVRNHIPAATGLPMDGYIFKLNVDFEQWGIPPHLCCCQQVGINYLTDDTVIEL